MELKELFDHSNPEQCADAVTALMFANAAVLSELVFIHGEHKVNGVHLLPSEQIATLKRIVEFFRSRDY